MTSSETITKTKIAIVALGYVGLPIAMAFGKIGQCFGYDNNFKRIDSLKNGEDWTKQFSTSELKSTSVHFTSDLSEIKNCNFFIICVPTPITEEKKPDLSHLQSVSSSIGSILKKGDLVVYESTVYPGVTEEVCLPILEQSSGLKAGTDFKIGYSPERINPGDSTHTIESITKIVAAQDSESLETIACVYSLIVKAGIHKASSIKVAEAAKVIENTQRDLNIALMNELSIIFDHMNLPTQDILEAAATKWNFQKFVPGLVGGHCIGVDPYYLTYRAEQLGYHPQVILAGRKINDEMSLYVAERIKQFLLESGMETNRATVTILGITFKENCPDIRNSKINDVILALKKLGIHIQIHDPQADPNDVDKTYSMQLTPMKDLKPAHVVMIAVAHEQFKLLNAQSLQPLLLNKGIVIDLKSCLVPLEIKSAGYKYWRL